MIDEAKVGKALGVYTDLVNTVRTMTTEELKEFENMTAMINLLIKARLKEAGYDSCD